MLHLSALVVVLDLAVLVGAGFILYRSYLNNQKTNSTLIIQVPDGSGSSIPGTGIHSFKRGELVNVTAYPEPGWRFDHWVMDGANGTYISPLTLSMSSNHTLEAVFARIQYVFNVSTSGLGSVAKSPSQAAYTYGSSVQLTATPSSGWSFSGWRGDLSGSVNPATVTVDGNKTVTATFTQNVYMLTVAVSPSSSAGKVTPSVSPPYHYGDVVTLTESPSAGYVFSAWSGEEAGAGSTRSVTITGNMTITAIYTQNQYNVTVSTSGQGSVAKSPSQATYIYGSSVQLTATPSSGWSFSGWSGDLSGSVNPATVTVDGNKTVTVTFMQINYTLTIQSPNGSGSTNPSTGLHSYASSSKVKVTAVPTQGWLFDHWVLDNSILENMNPLQVVINSNHTLRAFFESRPSPPPPSTTFSLTVSISGQGSVIKSPDQVSYASGSTVQLTATPASGWSFSRWSVSLSGSANPATLKMSSDKAVTATFTQNIYTLTVMVSPSVGGMVSPSISPPYHYGDVVTLTESPSPSYTFSAWSGDGTWVGSTRSVTVTGNMAVTATFTSSGGLSPLHVEGKLIKDSSGNTVILRGVNIGNNFFDNPGASWMGVVGWNSTRVSQELDIIKSWGCNCVRIHECYQYWIQNTVDPVSGLTHRQIVHDLASLCNQKGLYLILDGYDVLPYGATGNRQTPLPFPPDENSYELAVIPDAQTWINMWSSAATSLKDLPNVIIEPHNEPVPDSGQDEATQRTLWFTNLQSCITAIRGTGFTGLILYQWEYGTYTNLDFPWTSYTDLTQSTVSAWVYNYPLTDPLNNLVVSTHQYWDNGHLGMWTVSHGAPPTQFPTAYSDLLSAVTNEGILYVMNTLNKPVIIGECGADIAWSNQTLMQSVWTNQLQVYNDLGISYSAFWFRNSGVYSLITSDSSPQPNAYGTILINKIAGK